MGATRRVRQITTSQPNPWTVGYYEFPKDKNGVLYVRQSGEAQVKYNVHSYEMQTDKLYEYFRDIGCTGHIEIIDIDEGMSGTLDIHERPGMSRLWRMIHKEEIGWIGAVHVNRFFRDQFMIGPDMFIKACYEHNIWVATPRMTYNFKDDYSQKIFRIEAEEAANYLKTMKLIMGGAWRLASSNGFYDGRTLIPGYIVDRSDPRRKRYIVYEPHAKVIRWLFKRFLELDGNFRRLCREVERMEYLFPKFEPWVDTLGLRRRKDSKTTITVEGHYTPTETGLKSILTNPAYIGWWLPIDGGCIENNHEPIVDEELFVYAHKRLSPYNLQGERQKPQRVTRNGHAQALIKKVIEGPKGCGIYPLHDDYVCQRRTSLSTTYDFSIAMKVIDTAFLTKFLEHVESIDPEEFSDWEEKVEQITQARVEKRNIVVNQLRRAERRMAEIMADLRDPEIPLTKAMKIAYAQEHAGLEKKKAELESELDQEAEEDETDDEVLYEISTIIPDIVQEWENLKFETRMRLIGALVRRVVVDHVAPSWILMEIEWKRSDWSIDVAHIRRSTNRGFWSDEEEQILQELYPTADAAEILQALPERSWSGIQDYARKKFGLVRLRNHRNSIEANTLYRHLSFLDVVYAKEHGLDASNKNVQWARMVI